ncbi:MAG: hypothetical protein QOG83_2917 [Alphaproteobacteria bacterium]|nr:hypothetical protein [Alphaproteobacteria bacterium]
MVRKLCTVAFGLLVSVGIARAQQREFTVTNTTPDCRGGSRATHQVCLSEGQKVKSWTITTTGQAGKRAAVESQRISPTRPNCLNIVTAVEPNGENCIKAPLLMPVCNCLGRGWITLQVTVVPE